jgi:hypothetical protein
VGIAATVTVNEVLDAHAVLDIECLDRIYLNGYVPNLETVGRVVSFLTTHLGYEIPSPPILDKIGNRVFAARWRRSPRTSRSRRCGSAKRPRDRSAAVSDPSSGNRLGWCGRYRDFPRVRAGVHCYQKVATQDVCFPTRWLNGG